MKIRKCIAVFLAAVCLIFVFPFSAGAEGLKAPVVQFKLINHDEIALRWDGVNGADYYRIYRTDVETGKTVKYDKTVKETETNIKGLSAETDYIFKVAAVSEKDGEVIAEVKSVGTYITTPKEWYFKYGTIKETREHREEKGYFRENYSGTVQEKINVKKVKNIIDIIAYCDGWYYFIAYNGPTVVHDATPEKYIGRIKEDGREIEILFDDLFRSMGSGYIYKYDDNYIYLYVYSSFESTDDFLGFDPLDRPVDDKICYRIFAEAAMYKISLKTGKVTALGDIFALNSFNIDNGYIYYVYSPLKYNAEQEVYYYDYNGENYAGSLCRMKIDSTGKEEIYKFSEEIDDLSMYIYNNEIYFYDRDFGVKIYKMPLTGGDIKEVFSSKFSDSFMTDFEIVNEYIYFTGYEKLADYTNNENKAYYRLKTDGTGLTKQNKPFEWKY